MCEVLDLDTRFYYMNILMTRQLYFVSNLKAKVTEKQ